MYGSSLLYIGCSRLYTGCSVMRVDMYPERALQETLASTWTPFRALVFRTRFIEIHGGNIHSYEDIESETVRYDYSDSSGCGV